MATITRRYLARGPEPQHLKLTTDPGLTLAASKFAIAYDVTFDDAVVSVAALDEEMALQGYAPDTQNTIALAQDPFLGLVSPDGSVWRLQVSDLGVFTVDKVSA